MLSLHSTDPLGIGRENGYGAYGGVG